MTHPLVVAPGEPPRSLDRTPPQDLGAEQCVLGATMLSKDAIADVVEALRGADFYRPAHEMIFNAVIDLYGRGEPADAITVGDELTKRGELTRAGGLTYLHTLLSVVPVAANAGYYAEIVREKAILRRLVDASVRINQMSYAAEGDVDDIVDRAQAEVYAVTERRVSEDFKPLAELMQPTLDEMEAISSRGGQLAGVPTGFADLDDLTNGLHAGQMVIVAARPGCGKALALDTPLPTPTGWTTMGEIQPGDQLLGADGRPTRVVAATEVLVGRPCYRINFSDGTEVIADAEHEWQVTSRAARRATAARRLERCSFDEATRHHRAVVRPVDTPENFVPMAALLTQTYPRAAVRAAVHDRIAAPAGPGQAESHPERLTTEQLAQHVRTGDGRANWAVSLAAPLDLPEAKLSLDPYALGVWLGDGTSARADHTSADAAIYTSTDAAIGETYAGGRGCRECHDDHGSVQTILRTLGVLGDKRIPTCYARASITQRRALLAGLLDTDGTVGVNGQVCYPSTSSRLANDVLELVIGLGYRATMSRKRVAGRHEASCTASIVQFAASDDVFRLERKRAEHEALRSSGRERSSARYITEITPVPSVPVRCVQVDNADHQYLATRAMIPTHNSTLALDLARSASIKHGLSSVIFSLEMSQIEITMRLLSAEASIPLSHIRGGKMSDDDWSRVATKMGQVSEAPMFIDDSPNLTMMEIRAKARRLKQRHDLKLILIDYIQLMTSGKKVESRQLEVSEFSRQIKLLAKELEVPVVALSQLNRGPEQRTDKKPMLSDLRESGSLEQDADMVVLLHRPDLYDRESDRAGEADFIVAKHRNGPTAELTVAFQGHYSRFTDMQR